ncbi:CHAT domain-containing protein [Lipingzhangella sp. LS1_29]|uniref:CHAT domain-containing protein n=1 Tax=Lipingzhangella rawalii TaxID=2055835 RepID=A0ABU2H6D4_9ACTN|nr:CHAT domain-containing protein [Lipingzhangella rawalii]MDS1270850.1 CHAT domain-containing protein [Lipingzhangella rawalii]
MRTRTVPDRLSGHAHAAIPLVARDPDRAHALARCLLTHSAADEVRAVAWRALALAGHELGADPFPALRQAVLAATRAGLSQQRSLALRSLLGLQAHHRTAVPPVPPPERPAPNPPGAHVHLWLRRGVAQVQGGAFDPASTAFSQALKLLGSEDHPSHRVGLRNNRALSHIYADRTDDALGDLEVGTELAQRHHFHYLHALLQQNAGILAARTGDLDRAMTLFDTVHPWLRGNRAVTLTLDRAEAFLWAGDPVQARAVAAAFRPEDPLAEFAVLRLVAAHSALRRGDQATALVQARRILAGVGTASPWMEAARRVAWAARDTTRHPRIRSVAPPDSRVRVLLSRYRTTRRLLSDPPTPYPPHTTPRELARGLSPELEWERARLSHRLRAQDAGAVPAIAPRERTPTVSDRAVLWLRTSRGRLVVSLRNAGQETWRAETELDRVRDVAAGLMLAARSRPRHARVGSSLSVAAHLAELHRLLFTPTPTDLYTDRGVIIVPDAAVPALPWGMLAPLRGREVSVLPDLRVWSSCRRRVRCAQPGPVLLAAGPGLAGARAELQAIRTSHPSAHVLQGPAAHTHAVLDGLRHCAVAHLAGHGITDADNPMCSGLLLTDGPLTSYDLTHSPRLPPIVVLASCTTTPATPAPEGQSPGAWFEPNTLDPVTAPVRRHATTVIASTLPVDDTLVAPAMARAHRALSSGTSPAAVVARYLSGAGFVCYGAG